MSEFDFFGDDDDAPDPHADFFADPRRDRDRRGDRDARGDRDRRDDRRRRGGRDSAKKKRSRRRRRSGGGALLLALIVIIAFVGGAGYVGYTRLRDYMHPPDYSGTGYGHVLVHVRSGDTATVMADTLTKKDVVARDRKSVV